MSYSEPARGGRRRMGRVAAAENRLDHAGAPANNGAPRLTVRLLERPDPDGRRWTAAIELLLQAARGEKETRVEA